MRSTTLYALTVGTLRASSLPQSRSARYIAIHDTNPSSFTSASSSSLSRYAAWYCLKKCIGSNRWLPYCAKKFANIGFGSGNTYWKVRSSIFTNSQPRTSR